MFSYLLELLFIFLPYISCYSCGKWKCYLLSHVRFFATPWTIDPQNPLSMEFSRQEYWSGELFLYPDIPDTGIELGSPASQADSLPSEPPGKPLTIAGPLYFQFHICGFNCQETETIEVGCNSRKFRKNKAWICCAPVAMHIALTLSLQLVTWLLHCTGITSHLEMIYSMWEDMQILHHFIKGTWASADFDILNGLGTKPAAVHLANSCPKMLKCCLGGGELNCRDVG